MSDTNRTSRAYGDYEIGAIARQVEDHDFERIAPPAQVWNNIVAEFEVERASEEALARSAQQRGARGPLGWIANNRVLSIAAALLLVAALAGSILTIRDTEADPTELATAQLTDQDLPVATDETASARFLCNDDGRCSVEVDLTGLPEAGADADLELWVINGDVTDMHSLGLVTDSGAFELPEGVTATDFPIVDISVEPRDGVEAHSGQSVLRGVFESSESASSE